MAMSAVEDNLAEYMAVVCTHECMRCGLFDDRDAIKE